MYASGDEHNEEDQRSTNEWNRLERSFKANPKSMCLDGEDRVNHLES